MKKCDVCGKNSLLSEKLGESNICKICLLKLNAPVWKYRNIESMKDIEKYRAKAIESANKNDFPEGVLKSINSYFDEKNSAMKKCDACGENMLTIKEFNDSKICKHCYSKIDKKEWRNDKYISKEQLIKDKEVVIKIAKENNFPENALEYINEYFEKKAEVDWLYTLDGGRGQILKVYENYFSIITTNDFDIDDIAEDYAQIYNEDHPSKDPYSKSDAENVVRGVMSNTGGLVKDIIVAGITKKGLTSNGIAKITDRFTNGIENSIVSAVGKAYEEEHPDKKAFKKHGGERQYKYDDFEIIEFRDVGDDYLGYLKFQNKNTMTNSDFDILFFYGAEAKKEIIKMMPEVYNFINKKIREKTKVNVQNNERVQQKENKVIVDNSKIVEDIKRFKELLDIGAITQEEYDQKKKELLNL